MFNYLITLLRIYSTFKPLFDILRRYISLIKRLRKAETELASEIQFVTDTDTNTYIVPSACLLQHSRRMLRSCVSFGLPLAHGTGLCCCSSQLILAEHSIYLE